MKIRISSVVLLALLISFSQGSFAQKKNSSSSQKKNTSTGQQHKTGSKTGSKQGGTTILKFTPEQIDGFKDQSTQMVKFFEGTLNFLADKRNPVKEKQIIINDSYQKTFWDSKVQIEDDLDEKRLVTLFKDVQAYLSDVDFFFKRAKFQYTVQDVNVLTNEAGQTYFKVTANRNITGMTVNNDSVNNNKVRYFEINYDETREQLKIVSIYTTKYDERDELRNWWIGLSAGWKTVFGKDQMVGDQVRLDQIASFHDSTASVNGADVRIDQARLFALLAQISNGKDLDVSGNTSITEITPLSRMTSLKSVNLSNTGVSDLMPLRNLNGLETLDISGTQVVSLDPLKYDNNLRVLKLKKTGVDNIELISGFPLMEVLDLSNTPTKDLTPLKDLTGIKDLRVSGTGVTDLQPISGLINTEILYLSDLDLTDISPIRGFTRLQLLILDNTKVSSLAAVEDISALKKIYCNKTGIKRGDALTFMQKHPEATVIFISDELTRWWGKMPDDWKKTFLRLMSGSGEPNAEQLHRLITIDSINISGRLQVNTLDPISEFVQLRYLDCSSTSVSSPEPLKQLELIRTLNLSNSKITTVDALSGIANLEVLTLDNTGVGDLSPLKNLANLRLIFADNTQVSSAGANDFMDASPNCLVVSQTYEHDDWWKNLPPPWKSALQKQAGVSGNPDKIQLQRIAGLEALVLGDDANVASLQPVLHMSRLKEFQFTDTRVSSLEPLGQMKRLTAIRCMKNPINDLLPLSGMSWLKELDFSNTQIEDLTPIQNLRSIEILKFSGTPVKNLKYLQNLTSLKVLECYNTRVSSLDVLEPISSLKTLKIFNTKISEKKVAKFKQTHPGCEVVFY